MSSVAALGRKPGEPVHEDVPFEDGRDVSQYARSKFAESRFGGAKKRACACWR